MARGAARGTAKEAAKEAVKEIPIDIIVSDENLTDLYTEEKLLKLHILKNSKPSAEQVEAVKNAKLKSSCLAVVLSAFFGLFGIGSLYLGYWRRGICKIVFNILLPVAVGMIFLYWLAPLQEASIRTFMEILFTILLSIECTIIVAYWIGEVFKDRAKCLRDNSRKIKSLLQ